MNRKFWVSKCLHGVRDWTRHNPIPFAIVMTRIKKGSTLFIFYFYQNPLFYWPHLLIYKGGKESNEKQKQKQRQRKQKQKQTKQQKKKINKQKLWGKPF